MLVVVSALNGDVVAIELLPEEDWVPRARLAALASGLEAMLADGDDAGTPMPDLMAAPGLGSERCVSHDYRAHVESVLEAVSRLGKQPVGKVVGILTYVHPRTAVGVLDINVRDQHVQSNKLLPSLDLFQ